jgi:9-cis-epoxycarotenoid dioxygenase
MTKVWTLLVFLAICVALVAFILANLPNHPQLLLAFSKFLTTLQPNEVDFNANTHAYLQGVFKPVHDEFYNVSVEIVSGRILPELQGIHLYNGPNPTDQQLQHRYHFFDGHGYLRALHIQSNDKPITFSSQYIKTPSYLLSKLFNQSVFIDLGEVFGIVGLMKLLIIQPLMIQAFRLNPLDVFTANTAFLMDGNRLYATHEGSVPYEIRLHPTNEIQSIGFQHFENVLDYPFPAHTRRDPIDGKLYFQGYNPDNRMSAYKAGERLILSFLMLC